MASSHVLFIAFVDLLFLHLFAAQSFNPTILQDSRDLPKVDGTFGFLYRTEDGIAHAAKGDSDGVIHGRFTYTDPTGLKVNYNYNAGSRVAPGYKYDDPPIQPPRKYTQVQYQEPEYREPQPAEPEYVPQSAEPEYVPQPAEPEYVPRPAGPKYGPRPAEPEFAPQARPAVRSQVRRPSQYRAQFRDEYQPQRRARPQYGNRNDVFED